MGGVATDSITEDILTTVRLHRHGWRTVYHNDVLARGLAAADAHQYATQRLRWGTGAMQVLRGPDNPLTCPGLRLSQRACYAATLMGWFDAWRSLGYLLVPMVVLVTGAVPIRADVGTFAIAFGVTFALQRLALARLGRGLAPMVTSTVFDIVRLAPNLAATGTLLGSRDHSFNVTPKGRTGTDRVHGREPVLLDLLLLASTFTAMWFAASAAGWTPLHYGVPWAAFGAAGWLVVNSMLVSAAVSRIRHPRFAAERRASVRFAVSLDGALATTTLPGDPGPSHPVRIVDLSLTGARICARELPESGTVVRLAVHDADGPLVLEAQVRGRWRDHAGLEFGPGQVGARAQLARRLFHDEVAGLVCDESDPSGSERPIPAPGQERRSSHLAMA